MIPERTHGPGSRHLFGGAERRARSGRFPSPEGEGEGARGDGLGAGRFRGLRWFGRLPASAGSAGSGVWPLLRPPVVRSFGRFGGLWWFVVWPLRRPPVVLAFGRLGGLWWLGFGPLGRPSGGWALGRFSALRWFVAAPLRRRWLLRGSVGTLKDFALLANLVAHTGHPPTRRNTTRNKAR